MKPAFYPLAAIALLSTAPTYAHSADRACELKLGEAQDLRSWLFQYSIRSILASENLAKDIAVLGSLSDDNLFDAARSEKPVERLLELMLPTSFRRPRQDGIIRVIGDPCGAHTTEFEAVSQTENEVWKLEVELEGGKIQSISADRFHYEVVQ